LKCGAARLEERLHEAEANLASVTGQNKRLAATLREARDQIVALKEEVDRLAQPPSGFGIFLQANEAQTSSPAAGRFGVAIRVHVTYSRRPATPTSQATLGTMKPRR